jgi:hypothetical protein
LIGLGRTATALATIGTGYIREITLNNDGYGYTSPPTIDISSAPSGGTNASAKAITELKSGFYSIKQIVLTNAGNGYTVTPNHYNYSVMELVQQPLVELKPHSLALFL